MGLVLYDVAARSRTCLHCSLSICLHDSCIPVSIHQLLSAQGNRQLGAASAQATMQQYYSRSMTHSTESSTNGAAYLAHFPVDTSCKPAYLRPHDLIWCPHSLVGKVDHA